MLSGLEGGPRCHLRSRYIDVDLVFAVERFFWNEKGGVILPLLRSRTQDQVDQLELRRGR